MKIRELFQANLSRPEFISESSDPQSPLFVHNAHIHLAPNFSAYDSLEEACLQAKTEGLQVLGASNYYDYSVYERFSESCLSQGIFPLFGIEIIANSDEWKKKAWRVNDPQNPGRVYLCGKGICRFEKLNPAALNRLLHIRNQDSERINEMALLVNQYLKETGFPDSVYLDTEAIKFHISQSAKVSISTVYLQERHLMKELYHQFSVLPNPSTWVKKICLQELNFNDAVLVQNTLRSSLLKAGKVAFVPEKSIHIEEALDLISNLGGIAAYPIIGDGIPGISEAEKNLPELLRKLRAWNIDHIEWIPTRNSPEYLRESVTQASELGFSVSVGTEHNTPLKESLIPSCKGQNAITPELLQKFCEGSLRIITHQLSGFGLEPEHLKNSLVNESQKGWAWLNALKTSNEKRLPR